MWQTAWFPPGSGNVLFHLVSDPRTGPHTVLATPWWVACLVFFRLGGGGVSFREAVCALKKAGVLGGGDKGWLETYVKDFAITSFVPQGNEEPQETRVAGPGIVHGRQVPCGFPGVRGAEKWPWA